jgi:glutamate formiminotransferase
VDPSIGHHAGVLECVINVSEGRDLEVLGLVTAAAGPTLLDVHRDPDHHRAVFTLGGPDDRVEQGVRSLASAVIEHLDIGRHQGAHPRIGTLDVVPFVALDGPPIAEGPLLRALAARDRFVDWAATELGLPCFRYGPERSLPEIRRGAWGDLAPDQGPDAPHPRAGAVAVGARPVLVAYNLWLERPDLALAREIAREIRGPDLRTLGLAVGSEVQVSCNLIAPWSVGPAAVHDAVAGRAGVARAELVGLIPSSILEDTPRSRWKELDLAASATIEARLERAGLRPPPQAGS